jgi:hypothetical protein
MFSMLNLKYLDWQDPYILITAAETELLCAEAAVRGWITSNAETHFNNGVTAAINQWTAFDPSFARSAAEVTAYIAGRKFGAANTADRLKLISEEYWAATWLDDIEAWSNWRRTGIPTLVATKDPNAEEGATIPRRLRYWENEAGSNPANYKAAVDRMGGDKFLTKMWWDGGN